MKDSKLLKSLDIFGIPVTQLESYQHAEDIIVCRVRDKQKTFCVAVNPEKIYQSQKDNEPVHMALRLNQTKHQ